MFGRIARKLPRLGRKRRALRKMLSIGPGRLRNILQSPGINDARIGTRQPNAAPQVRQAALVEIGEQFYKSCPVGP